MRNFFVYGILILLIFANISCGSRSESQAELSNEEPSKEELKSEAIKLKETISNLEVEIMKLKKNIENYKIVEIRRERRKLIFVSTLLLLTCGIISYSLIKSKYYKPIKNEESLLECPRCGWSYETGQTECKNCKTIF